MDARIRWSPRVPQAKIALLYARDAQGIRDPELIDEVGWSLHARAADVLLVGRGRVRCPACGTEFGVGRRTPGDATFECPSGDWSTTAQRYRDSWRKQDLNGYAPELERYVERYPLARTPVERMLLIDGLLHAVHRTGGNLARNLIEGGRRNSPHAFLDRLACGERSTVDRAARERWASTRLNAARRKPSGAALPFFGD